MFVYSRKPSDWRASFLLFNYEPSPSQLGVSWSWTVVTAASEPHRLPTCLRVSALSSSVFRAVT